MRLNQTQDISKSLERKIKTTETQIETWMDQIVDATTPTAITAYERRIEKLEKDKIIWSEKTVK